MTFKIWLEESSYTITQLSKILGVSRQAIYTWLEGNNEPKLSSVVKLNALSEGKVGLKSFPLAQKGGANVSTS